MRRPARTVTAAVTAGVLAVTAIGPAAAQPIDPYGADPPPPPPDGDGGDVRPPDGAISGSNDGVVGDPEIDEAVARALVARARELIAVEAWQDAQQLLGEAIARSPGGAAAAEARPLLDEVNARLGVGAPAGGGGDGGATGGPGVGDTISWDDGRDDVISDPLPPPDEGRSSPGGRRMMWHSAGIGAVIGGFLGDAMSADLDDDGVDEEGAGGPFLGAVLGAAGGLAIGAGLRNKPWLTRDDVIVVDSFAGMGLVGSLSLGALMQPAEAEAYSLNAALGTAGGAITGLVLAKNRDISARRMARVDLWAAGGALAPWLIFGLADGDADAAQVAGFFSMAGLVGGAWLGFRLTRGWDRDPAGELSDAPAAVVQRSSAGAWTLGAPALRPSQDPRLGPVVGRGAAIDIFGGRF